MAVDGQVGPNPRAVPFDAASLVTNRSMLIIEVVVL